MRGSLRPALLAVSLAAAPLGATECVSGPSTPQRWQVAMMRDQEVSCSGVVVGKADMEGLFGSVAGIMRIVIVTAAHCLPESTHLRWFEANGSLSSASIDIREKGLAIEPLDLSHKLHDVAFLRLLLTPSEAERFSVMTVTGEVLAEPTGTIWRVLPGKKTDKMSVLFASGEELKKHTDRLPRASTRLTSGIGLRCPGLEKSNSGSPVTVQRNGVDELVGVLSTISVDPDGDGALPSIAQVQGVRGAGPWAGCWTAVGYSPSTWAGIIGAEPKCVVWPAIKVNSGIPSIFKVKDRAKERK